MPTPLSQETTPLRSRGFSLIELAVVLVIIGTLLTLGIAAFNAQSTTSGYARTRAKLETIRESLIHHLSVNERLPCPDTQPFTSASPQPPDGRENRLINGSCEQTVGVLPYLDLGLSQDAVVDDWANLFTYHLTTQDNAASQDWSDIGALRLGKTGNLKIEQADGPDSDTDPDVIAGLLPVVIVSHGKNGSGAYTLKGTVNAPPQISGTGGQLGWEYQNTITCKIEPSSPCSTVRNAYRYASFTDDAADGLPYDDLVVGISAAELIGPPLRSGTLRLDSFASASGPLFVDQVTAQAFDSVFVRAIIWITSNRTAATCGTDPEDTEKAATFSLPDSLSAFGASVTDRWGEELRFVRFSIGSSFTCATSSSEPLYKIFAPGPDRTPSSNASNRSCDGDDRCGGKELSEIQATLQRSGACTARCTP